MFTHFLKYGILWICAITLAAAICPVRASAQVVISEVMWMGSDMSSADEWIEIANTSSGAVDLSGWEISYLSSGEEKVMFTFPEEFDLSAGEFGVISNYNLDKSRLSDEPMMITSSMSLPNSKLLISLIDKDGNLIDQVDDGIGAPFAGSKSPWASMERIDLGASGSDKNNWKTSEISKGFDDGIEIYGSPGYFEETEEPEETEGTEEPEESEESEETEETEETEESDAGVELIVIPNVYISEILPNPEGKDDGEWIEIVNDEEQEVDVSNWIIKRSGDKYNFNDYSLGPKSIAVFMKSETELSLKNSGDTIEIFSGSILIDSFSYPTAHDEVSFGRKAGDKNSFASYCVPTKGELNQVKKLYPRILVESGKKRAEAKVTVNFKAISDHGSLNSASCVWNFDDGFESYKCNPPSHIFSEVGTYAVTLSVETVCGNFEEATEYVEVWEKYEEEKKEQKKKEEEKVQEDNSELEVSCIPTASTGIKITEIFPSPSNGEEWVEIENQTEDIFNLCGWILDDVLDGGSKPWTFEDVSIPPSEKIKLMQSQTKISFNNTGDEVWLISPDGFKTGFKFPKIKSDETFGFAQPILAYSSSSSTPGGYWEKDGLDGAEPVVAQHAVPLEKKYKNIIPTVSAEDLVEEKVMTGVFANLNIVESVGAQHAVPLLTDVQMPKRRIEISIVVIGIISSVGLLALKVLRG